MSICKQNKNRNHRFRSRVAPSTNEWLTEGQSFSIFSYPDPRRASWVIRWAMKWRRSALPGVCKLPRSSRNQQHNVQHEIVLRRAEIHVRCTAPVSSWLCGRTATMENATPNQNRGVSHLHQTPGAAGDIMKEHDGSKTAVCEVRCQKAMGRLWHQSLP
jgi:hypothetical protein